MSYNIPTLSALEQTALANLQAALGQQAPINDKSFMAVLSVVEAALAAGNYKYAANRALANLALTAIGSDLDAIGNNYSIPRKTAKTAVVTATLAAATGTVIPVTAPFSADPNSLIYYPQAQVTAALNVATLSLACSVSGSQGDLNVGDTLEIMSQITGANTTATVTAVTTIGVDQETDASYRPRILLAIRAITGGCNAMDHKIWAEAVTGVNQAFCYAGRPVSAGISYPGDRSIYVQAQTDVSADGTAPAWLLADVVTAIQTDPNTGLARQSLGLTTSTLWVYSIANQPIFFTISGLQCSALLLAACKAAILEAVTIYLANIKPFVEGIDLPQERNDTITAISAGKAIGDALVAYGAYATSVGVGLAVGVFFSTYTMGQGQLATLGGITYA